MTTEELEMHRSARTAARNECKQIHVELEELQNSISLLQARFDIAHKRFRHHDHIIAAAEQRIHHLPAATPNFKPRRRSNDSPTITVQLDPMKLSEEQASALLAQLQSRLGISLSPENED